MQTLSFFSPFILMVFLFSLPACNSVQKLQRQEELRKKALELAEKDLAFRLPEDGGYWAGFKSIEFTNGAPLKLGERFFTYSRKESRSWQDRRHFVIAEIDFSSGMQKRHFEIKYSYKESGEWSPKLKLEFIYGFPGGKFIHKSDPFAEFRDDEKTLRALRQRKAYVGMPEAALHLALGKPQTTESKTSLYGVEKKLIYSDQVIYLKEGKVVGRELRSVQDH